MDLSREAIEKNLAYYESQHKTRGCKITHMFGIPMVALGIPIFLFGNRRFGLTMFGLGAILQLSGHYVFEKNKPIFLGKPGDIMNYICALVFCEREWRSAAKLLEDRILDEAHLLTCDTDEP